MKPLVAFALVLVLSAAIVGCGDTPAPATNTSEQTSEPEPEPVSEPKPQKKITYKQGVIDCLSELYEVRKAGNATRVESGGGDLKANIQFFKTKDEAAEYFVELLVDGYLGSKAVAIWLNDAGDSDKAVIGECLGSQ